MKLILVLLACIAIFDFFDDKFLIALDAKANSMNEFILKTVCSVVEIVLSLWAFFIAKKIILKSKEKEKQYRRLIDLSPEAMIVHREGKILFVNKASVTLIGASSKADLLHHHWEELISFDSYNSDDLSIEKLRNNREQVLNHQIKAKRFDGQVIDLEITSTNIEYNGMPASEFIARDITIRKKQERKVKKLAYQDMLTELPNRRKFMDRLEKLLIQSRENKTKFVVIFIDLDGFKKVNDSLGHEAGDDLLRRVSLHLKSSVRENDTVARLGGDEFTILLPGSNHQECIGVVERIIENLNLPICLSNQDIRVTPSIGIALYPQDGEDAEMLLKQADIAMYQAKRSGKNCYRFANDSLVNIIKVTRR